jgi:hypothetical protein
MWNPHTKKVGNWDKEDNVENPGPVPPVFHMEADSQNPACAEPEGTFPPFPHYDYYDF